MRDAFAAWPNMNAGIRIGPSTPLVCRNLMCPGYGLALTRVGNKMRCATSAHCRYRIMRQREAEARMRGAQTHNGSLVVSVPKSTAGKEHDHA